MLFFSRTAKRLLAAGLCFALLISLCACAGGPIAASADPETEASKDTASSAAAASSIAPSVYEGEVLITEVMVHNNATVRDPDGDFPDWVELRNLSSKDINLAGWSLSDREGKEGLVFPAYLFPAGSCFVVYASGKDRPADLQAPFSLSGGETLYLRDAEGKPVSSAECPDLEDDHSYALQKDGGWKETLYPTPWQENTAEGYSAWQETLTLSGPLQINEALVSDRGNGLNTFLGTESVYTGDWVELKNISSETVNLAGWYLSDKESNLRKAALPDGELNPGELTVIRCEDIGLSLNSSNEALYLSSEEHGLCDWLPLRDIPSGGSYGRMEGRNGGFFFAKASENMDNSGGYRRVSAAPVATTPDGVFASSDAVVLDLQAEGQIYYTYDASVPDETALAWAGPTAVPATCIIRAIAVEPDALPSRAVTLNYFIGEEFSLPVVSLVSDSKSDFQTMYTSGWKGQECAGNVSFYEDGGSFSINCGIRMHGDTSLMMPKKGMSLAFRGAYGQDELNYDLFGGGVTCFSDLLLRGGQDQISTIIRNELCENLALAASADVVASRSRYCLLYVNGTYTGIYALTEKLNESHYANLLGVSKNSVMESDAEVSQQSELYRDVMQFCSTHNMAEEENYRHIQTLLDLDSLIDWVFLEGYFANSDLTYGNMRYIRSSEGDGLWRFVFYDLDATLAETHKNHDTLLKRNMVQSYYASNLFADMMVNPDFRSRFLTRAAELLNGPLTDEAVLSEIDRLAGIVAPEVERDFALIGRTYEGWEKNIQTLKIFIINNNWKQHNINAICSQLNVTAEERALYFGE